MEVMLYVSAFTSYILHFSYHIALTF